MKGRRLTRRNASRQLGFIRGLAGTAEPFDVLVGILFESDFRVRRAALIAVDVIRAHVARVEYVNGWRLILRESVWAMLGVVDATEPLRRAAEAPAR